MLGQQVQGEGLGRRRFSRGECQGQKEPVVQRSGGSMSTAEGQQGLRHGGRHRAGSTFSKTQKGGNK